MKKITQQVRHRIKVYTGFLIIGACMALWGISIPYIKSRLNIDDLNLGTILMFLSIGAIIAMIITDKIISILGCRRTFLLSVTALIFMLLLCHYAVNTTMLIILVTIMGIGLGIADVTANIQAAYMEKIYEKKLMSGFHGMYSFGSFAGGILASFLLMNHLNFNKMIIIMTILLFILLLAVFKGFAIHGSIDNAAPKSKIQKPALMLLIVGFMCFTGYMIDGAMLDWTAVLLTEFKTFPKENSGIGFSIYFAAVTIGRLSGDYFSARFSSKRIILVSSIIAAAGIVMVLVCNSKLSIYAGFIITGLGAANIIPACISMVDAAKGSMSFNAAIAAVTTIGYSGTLLGPVIIGYISHISNLLAAFIFICTALILTGIFSLILKEK